MRLREIVRRLNSAYFTENKGAWINLALQLLSKLSICPIPICILPGWMFTVVTEDKFIFDFAVVLLAHGIHPRILKRLSFPLAVSACGLGQPISSLAHHSS